MKSDTDMCIRCDEQPAVDLAGYCGHCHWAIRSEVEEGMAEMRQYLAGWARFREWEAQDGGRGLGTLASRGIAEMGRYLDVRAQFDAWCDANPRQADAARRALADLRARRDAGESA
jgi:hypothetical protein